MDTTTPSNSRRAPRYALKTQVFLVFRPHYERLGRLLDVSRHGVAFEYPVLQDYEKAEEVEVDLFSPNPHYFMLQRLPCKVIYDIRIDRPTFSGVETRRCGLEFEKLSDRQWEQLKRLLREFVLRQRPVRRTIPRPLHASNPSRCIRRQRPLG